MQLSYQLQQKLAQAVRVSMQIEGYSSNTSHALQEKAKLLMERYRVKVSIPAK